MNRPPIPALRPFVSMLWSVDGRDTGRLAGPGCEHVLPTGMTHLVFRLTDSPLRIFASESGGDGQAIDGAVVGGARSHFYRREMATASSSVGAVLRPGASQLLLGARANELAGRHVSLEQLWGGAARRIGDRLRETPTASARLDVLEAALVARLPAVRGMHPAIAHVVDRMHTLRSVEAAVRQSGLSHRHFIEQFRRSVGLAPKTWLRIRRFQQALRSVHRSEPYALAAVAVDAGYSDQAHFNRDFLAFTGTTPTAYRLRGPVDANHLPMPGQLHSRPASPNA